MQLPEMRLLGHLTADERDGRFFLQSATVCRAALCVQLDSGRSSDEGRGSESWSACKKVHIKEPFHVLKTTDEAPRCACTGFSFSCSCTPSVRVCWMAKQTDDYAEQLFVFDFAHLTQLLTFMLGCFVFLIVLLLLRPTAIGFLFPDWEMCWWCHVLYLRWARHLQRKIVWKKAQKL